MKKKRNRIASQGKEGYWEWYWYWLINCHNDSTFYFTLINDYGNAGYLNASYFRGVRPVFCLRLDSHELLEEE